MVEKTVVERFVLTIALVCSGFIFFHLTSFLTVQPFHENLAQHEAFNAHEKVGCLAPHDFALLDLTIDESYVQTACARKFHSLLSLTAFISYADRVFYHQEAFIHSRH